MFIRWSRPIKITMDVSKNDNDEGKEIIKLCIDLCRFESTNKITACQYHYIRVKGLKLIWKCAFKTRFISLWEKGKRNEPQVITFKRYLGAPGWLGQGNT